MNRHERTRQRNYARRAGKRAPERQQQAPKGPHRAAGRRQLRRRRSDALHMLSGVEHARRVAPLARLRCERCGAVGHACMAKRATDTWHGLVAHHAYTWRVCRVGRASAKYSRVLLMRAMAAWHGCMPARDRMQRICMCSCVSGWEGCMQAETSAGCLCRPGAWHALCPMHVMERRPCGLPRCRHTNSAMRRTYAFTAALYTHGSESLAAPNHALTPVTMGGRGSVAANQTSEYRNSQNKERVSVWFDALARASVGADEVGGV